MIQQIIDPFLIWPSYKIWHWITKKLPIQNQPETIEQRTAHFQNPQYSNMSIAAENKVAFTEKIKKIWCAVKNKAPAPAARQIKRWMSTALDEQVYEWLKGHNFSAINSMAHFSLHEFIDFAHTSRFLISATTIPFHSPLLSANSNNEFSRAYSPRSIH